MNRKLKTLVAVLGAAVEKDLVADADAEQWPPLSRPLADQFHSPGLAQRRQGRQRGADAAVVGDVLVSVQRDVEIAADEDPLAGEIAEIDPGADGAYRFTIGNAGNAPLTQVVAYDILPYVGDVGVGPAANQARESRWKPNLNSTTWAFQSVKQKPGRDPEITAVPASDITVQYSTVPNPCRGEVLSAGGAETAAHPYGIYSPMKEIVDFIYDDLPHGALPPAVSDEATAGETAALIP